jgi:hypothetical protein
VLLISDSGDCANVTNPCVWGNLKLVVSLDLQDLIVKMWKNFLNIYWYLCQDTISQLIKCVTKMRYRSHWPRVLRRSSAAARLLRSCVRIPPMTWMFVCCECCVLSCRGLSDELIARPEESYWLWCVIFCDLNTSIMRRPWLALGRSATRKKAFFWIFIFSYVKIQWHGQ